MKSLRVASLTLAMMILALVAPARPAVTARCALVPEPVNTLTVKFETDKKAYRLGGLMKVKVTVTRPGPKDPVLQEADIPSSPASMPVEGAVVAVTLRSGGDSVTQNQGGMTNSAGVSNVRLKIKTYHEPGIADISVFATKVQYDDGVCIHVWEQGYIYKKRAVTLLP